MSPALLLSRKLNVQIHNYTPLSPTDAQFLKLAHHFYGAYLDCLSKTGEDDFDGLLQRAAEAIGSGHTMFFRKQGDGDLNQLRYIFIDEFQDFSDLFFKLIRAIKDNNEKVELFCVGDDWQAINGFAGSDLKYFENFKEYVGSAQRLYISKNYRSYSKIVESGNALMSGFGKPAVADKGVGGEVLLCDLDGFEPSVLENERHSGDDVTPAVLRLVNKALSNGKDVVILSRRNALPYFVNYFDKAAGHGRKDLSLYLDLIRSFLPKDLRNRVTISTTHKYKGLQKSLVVVIDAVVRSYPLVHPDWVFTRVLGDCLEKIIEEERRLLYVALTRASDSLVIVTEGRNKSPFLKELEGRVSIPSIDWGVYPPLQHEDIRIVVHICNQAGLGASPTMNLRDLLKASGYQYLSTKRIWAKSFPVNDSLFETLKAEIWAQGADGVLVKILNESDQVKSCFSINQGVWGQSLV